MRYAGSGRVQRLVREHDPYVLLSAKVQNRSLEPSVRTDALRELVKLAHKRKSAQVWLNLGVLLRRAYAQGIQNEWILRWFSGWCPLEQFRLFADIVPSGVNRHWDAKRRHVKVQ